MADCIQRAKRFSTQKQQQQQNANKHISRRKHAGQRRGKHGGQGGGESRHCARVRETRQVRIVGSQELSPETLKQNKEPTHRRPTPLSPARAFPIFSQHTPLPRRGRQLRAPADSLAPLGRLAPCGLVSSSLRRSARRKRWPQGHPPTISSAAADRLHAGYVSLTSLRRRAMSATLDMSAAMASRPITISVGWARGRPC